MNKINETKELLKAMGLPRAQQNERSALTLLALLDMKEDSDWSDIRQRMIRIHDILLFIQKIYSKEYAENTRETIRRQTLHQFIQAGLVEKNPDNLSRPTNSPNTVYTVISEAMDTIKKFGTKEWKPALSIFIKNNGKLVDKYKKKRRKSQLSLDLPNKLSLSFSPGKHNELQVKIINECQPRFFPKANLIYIGDTANKMLYFNKNLAKNLKIPITQHDKLPDVVLYDTKKKFLLLIEAVTSHGPITPKRQMELEETLKKCKIKKIYISVFPDFRQLKRHIDKIAWETEIWIADNPSHMIHFNGPKFLTVY